jgi:uncharacterized membrane protein
MEAINDSGLSVGNYYDGTGNRSFLWQNGSMLRLDYPGATNTEAIGINNLGEVVGNWNAPSAQGAFLYYKGQWTGLAGPNGVVPIVGGINDSGEYVGAYSTADGNIHGFVNSGGTYQILDYPGATRTWAMGINNAGEIVGYYESSSCVQVCSFLAKTAASGFVSPTTEN